MDFLKTCLIPKERPEDTFRSPDLIFENDGDAYVWRFGPDSDSKFLIYLNPHTGLHPSAEHAWLFIVDRFGTVLSRDEFDTGWRMYAGSAVYEAVSWCSDKVLIQRMQVGLNGGGPRGIYIGFDRLKPHLIRIEDAVGKIVPMEYYATNWVVGPAYAPPTLDDLLNGLRGVNQVKRFEALVWLGGSHQRASQNKAGYDHEAEPQERLYADAIMSKPMGAVIQRLRQSSNPYERELAGLVPIGVGHFEHFL